MFQKMLQVGSGASSGKELKTTDGTFTTSNGTVSVTVADITQIISIYYSVASYSGSAFYDESDGSIYKAYTHGATNGIQTINGNVFTIKWNSANSGTYKVVGY